MATQKSGRRKPATSSERASSAGADGSQGAGAGQTWARRRRGAQIDELDLGILSELQEDGRRPFKHIAEALGVSEGAVRQRVTRMKDAGILHINANVSSNALGLRLVTTALIRVTGEVTPIADKLAESPEIEYIVVTGGSYDLMVEIVCEDTDELLEVLDTRIRSLPGVNAVELLMHLDLHKWEFEWGRRVLRAAEPPSPT